MKTATLHIDAPDGVRVVTLDDELTIGRPEFTFLRRTGWRQAVVR